MRAKSNKAHPFPWGYAMLPFTVAALIIAYAVFYNSIRPARESVTDRNLREFETYVVDPCFKAIAQRTLPQLSQQEAVSLLRV